MSAEAGAVAEASALRGRVMSVNLDGRHRFSKPPAEAITLVEGFGVQGDAHAGATDQHRSHARRDPLRPNLRQVHLIHSELFDEVARKGYPVTAGQLGENVTTAGIDLLALPKGALLTLGEAVVEITGLRNPCSQINGIGAGLLAQMVARAEHGSIVRKTGVMSVVRRGGVVRPGDEIVVALPDRLEPLEPV